MSKLSVSRFSSLQREIVILLAVKVCLITAAWWLWFSNPQDEHLQDADLLRHLAGEHPIDKESEK